MPSYLLDLADIWARRGYNYIKFTLIQTYMYCVCVRLEMLVFRVVPVLLVKWFDYVNAAW